VAKNHANSFRHCEVKQPNSVLRSTVYVMIVLTVLSEQKVTHHMSNAVFIVADSCPDEELLDF